MLRWVSAACRTRPRRSPRGRRPNRAPPNPTTMSRGDEVDHDEQDDHRDIGEEVDGEAAHLRIAEDALAPLRVAQEIGERVGGDADAPAERHPDEPEIVRRAPEIDGRHEGDDHDIGDNICEQGASGGVLWHVRQLTTKSFEFAITPMFSYCSCRAGGYGDLTAHSQVAISRRGWDAGRILEIG